MSNTLKKSFLIAVLTLSYISLGWIPLSKTDFSLTIYAGDNEFVFSYPEIDVSKQGLYLKDINNVCERIRMDTYLQPIDAQIVFNPKSEERFTFIKEQDGKIIDENKLKSDILFALKNEKTSVDAKFLSVQPSNTINDVKAFTYLRSEFSTDYSASIESRKHNVKLASDLLNGLCIEQGEEFSFNEAVGERSYERGFLDAKIIFDGKFADGVGGGVCQVSSTLFNATLLSGLTVTERHPHSLAVSYVEPSFDAMVSFGVFDLKFLNDTDGPIFLEMLADGSTLKARFYGQRQDYKIKRTSEIIKSVDLGIEIIDDPLGELCGEMEEKMIIYPRPSILSQGRIEKIINGKVVNTIDLGKSNYGGIKGVLAKKTPLSNVIDESYQ